MTGISRNNYNPLQLKLMRLPQENKPEGEGEQSQPTPAAPQKAPAANQALIKAMNSQTGANVLAALNRLRVLNIDGTIATATAGGTGSLGGTTAAGNSSQAGGPRKVAANDEVISTEKRDAVDSDGYKQTITTETYSSGKIVYSVISYFDDGTTRGTYEKTTYPDGTIHETQTMYYENKQEMQTWEKITDSEGNITKHDIFDYYEDGTPKAEYTMISDADKTEKHLIEYDESGEITKEALDIKNADGSSIEKKISCDENGNRIDDYEITRDANGNTTKQTGFQTITGNWYGEKYSGPTTCKITYNEDGTIERFEQRYIEDTGKLAFEITTIVDADGNTISKTKRKYEYDDSGKLITDLTTTNTEGKTTNVGFETTRSSWSSSIDSGYSITFTTYNADGSYSYTSESYSETSNKLTSRTEFSIDSEGNKNSKYTRYNENGEVNYLQETTTNKDGSKIERIVKYDESGKPISDITTTTDSEGKKTKVGYEIRKSGTWHGVNDNGYTMTTTKYHEDGSIETINEEYSEVYNRIVSKRTTIQHTDNTQTTTKTTYEYEDNGDIAESSTTTHPDKTQTITKTTYKHQANGNVIEESTTTHPDGSKDYSKIKRDKTGKVLEERYEKYDKDGKLINVKYVIHTTTAVKSRFSFNNANNIFNGVSNRTIKSPTPFIIRQ